MPAQRHTGEAVHDLTTPDQRPLQLHLMVPQRMEGRVGVVVCLRMVADDGRMQTAAVQLTMRRSGDVRTKCALRRRSALQKFVCDTCTCPLAGEHGSSRMTGCGERSWSSIVSLIIREARGYMNIE